MEIKICIGSACHLKGSYEVIKNCQAYIETHNLQAAIELKSAFCLGQCSGAVSVLVDGNTLFSILPESVESFMNQMHGRLDL